MSSRNCPDRLRASIAEDSRRLQEQELSQALLQPTTPRPAKRVRLEIPDSVATAVSEQSTPFSLRILLQNSESPSMYCYQSQLSKKNRFRASSSPEPVFRPPLPVPGLEYPIATSPIKEQP